MHAHPCVSLRVMTCVLPHRVVSDPDRFRPSDIYVSL